MGNKLNIENVTKGLLTFQKLKELYKNENREEANGTDGDVKTDRLTILQETLSSINDFMPQTRGGSFGSAFRTGSRYSDAYRGIKQHIRNMNGRNIDAAHFLDIMKLVAPMLSNKQRVYMDKVVRIFDILQS